MRFFQKRYTPPFLKDISMVFDRRIRKFGETPTGVLWKNSEGQQLRFEILAGILDDLPLSGTVAINDFGCGYGALFEFLCGLPSLPVLTYTGYDICKEMIVAARHRIDDNRATFSQASRIGTPADFTFVSGTFNLKLNIADDPWSAFIKSSLTELWSKSNKGLAFNMLDKNHPDRGEGLYYADAIEFLDFCTGLSANVTLIDNYPLDEWTIFVRR